MFKLCLHVPMLLSYRAFISLSRSSCPAFSAASSSLYFSSSASGVGSGVFVGRGVHVAGGVGFGVGKGVGRGVIVGVGVAVGRGVGVTSGSAVGFALFFGLCSCFSSAFPTPSYVTSSGAYTEFASLPVSAGIWFWL